MSDTANVLHEVIVVFLFPTVTMTVKVRNLIHNQMNMDFICIRVNRVHDLILRRIVLNNSLRVVIGLLRGDMFLSIKADNRMTYVLATVLPKAMAVCSISAAAVWAELILQPPIYAAFCGLKM